MEQIRQGSPYVAPGLLIGGANKRKYTREEVVRAVEQASGLPLSKIIAKTRRHEVVIVRFALFYYLYHNCDMPLKAICTIRPKAPYHHSTIINGKRTWQNALYTKSDEGILNLGERIVDVLLKIPDPFTTINNSTNDKTAHRSRP